MGSEATFNGHNASLRNDEANQRTEESQFTRDQRQVVFAGTNGQQSPPSQEQRQFTASFNREPHSTSSTQEQQLVPVLQSHGSRSTKRKGSPLQTNPKRRWHLNIEQERISNDESDTDDFIIVPEQQTVSSDRNVSEQQTVLLDRNVPEQQTVSSHRNVPEQQTVLLDRNVPEQQTADCNVSEQQTVSSDHNIPQQQTVSSNCNNSEQQANNVSNFYLENPSSSSASSSTASDLLGNKTSLPLHIILLLNNKTNATPNIPNLATGESSRIDHVEHNELDDSNLPTTTCTPPVTNNQPMFVWTPINLSEMLHLNDQNSAENETLSIGSPITVENTSMSNDLSSHNVENEQNENVQPVSFSERLQSSTYFEPIQSINLSDSDTDEDILSLTTTDESLYSIPVEGTAKRKTKKHSPTRPLRSLKRVPIVMNAKQTVSNSPLSVCVEDLYGIQYDCSNDCFSCQWCKQVIIYSPRFESSVREYKKVTDTLITHREKCKLKRKNHTRQSKHPTLILNGLHRRESFSSVFTKQAIGELASMGLFQWGENIKCAYCLFSIKQFDLIDQTLKYVIRAHIKSGYDHSDCHIPVQCEWYEDIAVLPSERLHEKCVVCYTNHNDTLLECGHCICSQCETKIFHCPICRRICNVKKHRKFFNN